VVSCTFLHTILLQNKRILGNSAEYVAEKFLVKRGFSIVYKNFYTKYGEIDIICSKNGILYFFEIKSVSCKTKRHIHISGMDHVTREKVCNLTKTINVYVTTFNTYHSANVEVELFVIEVEVIVNNFANNKYAFEIYKLL
jgi:putative endonuclease